MSEGGHSPDADFSFVRYANCWEDASLLVKALRPASGRRILSIASAGDNALALLASGAEVVAVDLNPAQLACTELRREALRALEHPDFLAFAGVTASDDRMEVYRTLHCFLSREARHFLDGHPSIITGGFIHAGKFERYFSLFRRRLLPLIHRSQTIGHLLQPKTREERIHFYETTWNNRRWRSLFNLFFSRAVMGKLGRDPAFFKHVEGRVSDRILQRTRYALTELDTSVNPYLRYILTGNYESVLPYYLQPTHYEAVRTHIDNLVLRVGSVDAVAGAYGPESFDGFNLSDIFEYLTEAQATEVYGRLLASARPGARLAYWNMLVPRAHPPGLAGRVQALEEEAEALFREDQAFFYSRFVLEEVR